MGITILSNTSLSDLAVSIATSDVKTLSKVKGLGKKTAERIILELREKVSCLDLPEPVKGKKQPEKEEKVTVNDDAVIALMSLGLKRSESVKLLKDAENEGYTLVEEQIAYALKHL
jgi:Holliday junction DNA helicase RuvA